MVIGLSKFGEHFKDFEKSYVIIGGTACDIVLEQGGFEPRATDDIDMILIVEALNAEFVKAFWEFIQKGGYKVQQFNQEKRNCYRFKEPADAEYPKQLELFSKDPDGIILNDGAHLTPIPVDEGLSSMSAILLDENYYKYTIANSDKSINQNDDNPESEAGVYYARPNALICLKAFAFLNNTDRKADGHKVQSVDIKKHKHDVFRMLMMIPEDSRFELPDSIRTDMRKFIATIENDLPSPEIFKDNGLPKTDMKVLFQKLIIIFQL